MVLVGCNKPNTTNHNRLCHLLASCTFENLDLGCFIQQVSYILHTNLIQYPAFPHLISNIWYQYNPISTISSHHIQHYPTFHSHFHPFFPHIFPHHHPYIITISEKRPKAPRCRSPCAARGAALGRRSRLIGTALGGWWRSLGCCTSSITSIKWIIVNIISIL